VNANESIKVLRQIEAASVYFSGTQYGKILEAARRAVDEGKLKGAQVILGTLPTDDQLLAQLVEKLKGKSVATTLERIRKREVTEGFTAMKGLSSLMTHVLIECEKGATEFRKLIPVILESLNTSGYKIIRERKVEDGERK